ncbi:hypothetical protein CPB83DRAFT_809508 [Crepidotus variabilis]|uniref:G domain-containing protein n=1 Tax=Crepidotus variabilis TaxID=179855 RepID=A0A9P6ELP6_9AGAR|nr:hypothetical protein CPB83DRAFT_809508 [Crepidotus variabilis]
MRRVYMAFTKIANYSPRRASFNPHSSRMVQRPTSTELKDGDTVFIVVLGITGCGKTTFINEASDSNLVVGKSLFSQTQEITLSKPFTVEPPGEGKKFDVILIDTPGFDNTAKTSDVKIRQLIKAELERLDTEKGKLAGAIYLHRISDNRIGDTATKSTKIFRQVGSHVSMDKVVISTSFWSKEQLDGVFREIDLEDHPIFSQIQEKGAQMMRHDSGKDSAMEIIWAILTKSPQAKVAQEERIKERKALSNQDNSQMLSMEFDKQAQVSKQEIRNLDAQLKGI